MAQTVTEKIDGSFTITFSDTSDFASTDLQGNKLKVSQIIFRPGAAGDKLYIRVGSMTGAKIPLESSDGSVMIWNYAGGKKMHLYIDYSECTLTSTAFVTIVEAD